jgi:hypothetical protein
VEGVDQQGRAEPRLLGAAIHSEASQQDDRSAMDTALYTTAPGWSSPPPEKRTEELIL